LNREQGEKLFLRHEIEFSPEGHAMLARTAAVYLVKNFPGAWRNGGLSPGGTSDGEALGGRLSSAEPARRMRDSRVRSAAGEISESLEGDR